ncbi:MAG: ethanolamine ammonia-lyase subunit EutB [Ruminococcus sp.]
MKLKTRLFGHTYEFQSLKEVMAKANEEKSGDKLAQIAAENAEERVAAKAVLSEVTLEELRNHPAVPYEEDEVTRIIQDDINEAIYKEKKNMTVGEFREWLLDEKTTGDMISRVSRGLTSEMVAAVCKLMGNMDLIYAAKKIRVTAHCNTTIGLPGTFSARLQPNHTTDDPKGIMASVMEGFSLGCGDAVLGLNPVDDSGESVARILKNFDEFKRKWEIPTQICVLAHITTQMEAIRKYQAPMDLMFQSIAGSQKGNEAFGITGAMLEEGRDMMLKEGTSTGPNVMYFETGQGSELSSDAHNGWDQLTMEARCYGFARHYQPFLVNTVVGFIGPEYLYDSRQVIRAGLEDHFMGKLSGVSMGCDACYTNHMKADQNDIENLACLLVAAGCNYIMGVPQADDCMLMYQSTGYHESAALREIFGLRTIPEFDRWLEKMGFSRDGKLTPLAGDASVFLEKQTGGDVEDGR